MQTILIDGKSLDKSNYELIKTEITSEKELYRRLKEQHPDSIVFAVIIVVLLIQIRFLIFK